MPRLTAAAALIVLCLGLGLSAHARVNLPDFSELADTAGAAVVNLSTVRSVSTEDKLRDFLKKHPQSGPFEDFFDQFQRQFKDENPTKRQRSMGTGFIISKDGYIVTNNHVVADAEEIKVQLRGKDKPMPAKVVGRDPELDLAVVKIDNGGDLPFLEFGDSEALKVGAWVVAIGNPFGLNNTVTAGILSAKGREIGAGPFDNFLQTDASINPGNSGGPLLNLDGKVVGINTAIVASGQGIGFAIPSSMAASVIADLREHKEIKRGWLGVSIQDVDENAAKALGMDEPKGALITSVMENEPAAKAGIQVGDVITSVSGKEVKDAAGMLRAVASVRPGSKAELGVWRKGKTIKLTATLGQRDVAKLGAAKSEPETGAKAATEVGLGLRPLKAEEARAVGVPAGKGLLVAEVAPGSPAADAEVKAGDVLLEVNQTPVDSVADFNKVIEGDARKKGVALLLLKRGQQNLFRAVALPEKK